MNGTSRVRYWMLAAYGCYALAAGIGSFIRGGMMVLAGGRPTESHFVGHLTQAHSGTLIGLGCLVLCLRTCSVGLRPVYAALLLGSALGAYVEMAAAPRGAAPSYWGIIQLMWAGCFLWLWLTNPGATRSATEGEPTAAAQFPSKVLRITAFTFSILMMASGAAWVFAAPRFAAAAAGSLAGSAAIFAGQTRGAADFALGAMSWLAGTRYFPANIRCLVAGAFIANFVLVVVGILAQLSVLSTPARWVVCGLHALWAIGFALSWPTRRLPAPSSSRS